MQSISVSFPMLSFLNYYTTSFINFHLLIQSQRENNSLLSILENTINVHSSVLMYLDSNVQGFVANPQTMKLYLDD